MEGVCLYKAVAGYPAAVPVGVPWVAGYLPAGADAVQVRQRVVECLVRRGYLVTTAPPTAGGGVWVRATGVGCAVVAEWATHTKGCT